MSTKPINLLIRLGSPCNFDGGLIGKNTGGRSEMWVQIPPIDLKIVIDKLFKTCYNKEKREETKQ